MEKFTKSALAQALLDEHPHAAKKMLGRLLFREHPDVFPTLENAYKTVLYAAGCNGSQCRKNRGIKNSDVKKGKAGWKPTVPPSLAEPWAPFQIDGPCKILSLSDVHVPYHSKEALESAVTYAKKKFNPDVLLLNGDFMDFYSISRYESNPKQRNLVREIEIGEAVLEWLADQFPKKRKVYKAGNHCERWDKYIWNHAPALWGLENMRLQDMLHLADHGFEFVGDQRPIMAGKLAIFHGHELGRGGFGAPVNPARGVFMRTLSSALVGHHHRTSTHAESDMWHSETVTWSTGCLCDRRPEYNRVSNKWNWGFAVVEVNEKKEYSVHNLRISDDYTVRTS